MSMETSESLADLATALSKAQGAVKGALKDSENPHFRSKYADLASVWDACREALAGNGLSVVQAPGAMDDHGMQMTTMLLHSSGQWIRETLTIPVAKLDPQQFVSACTYARRAALAAMVGVAPEDDDGNAAAAAGPAQRQDRMVPGKTRPEPLKGPIKTRADLRTRLAKIRDELHACGDADMLSAFLTEPETAAIIKQVEDEHEYFWKGDGLEFVGLEGEIANSWSRVDGPVAAMGAG